MSIGCKQHRIFVVDDEEIIATSLAMILQKSGFDATSFTHPLKALEASGSESPDLLISDVMMPELNGIDLAIRMKEICPECKVLLFSGQANTLSLLETARVNGNHFELIGKPVHPTDLLRKIHHDFGLAQASEPHYLTMEQPAVWSE
jgi:DNA-binding NtrC family response regulator